MILNLLKGKNENAHNRLNDLAKEIGENPSVLWYPSAGNDFRDILEMTKDRAKIHNIDLLPRLIIHTDYNAGWIDFNNTPYNDGRTLVEVEQKFELELINDIDYEVSPRYVYFPDAAPSEPTIYLMDIKITSDSLGIVHRSIIYFLFENINFLDQIILKNNLPISHIVKVREGCEFGGNRKSISIVYAFLSAMNTKYLIVDKRGHTDYQVVDRLQSKYNLELQTFDLNQCGSIHDWSGFEVNIFSVSLRTV